MSGDFSISKHRFDDQLCHKISIAIKRSNIFAHISPSDLIRKRICSVNLNSLDDKPLVQQVNTIAAIGEVQSNGNNSKENVFQSQNISLHDFLPTPDTLFTQSTPNSKQVIKSECIVNENERSVYIASQNKDSKANSESMSSAKPVLQSSFGNKQNTTENREKQNKNLSNLATSLLPLPTHLFGKHSMLLALENGNYKDFIKVFEEAVLIENEISSDDLTELIDIIINKKEFRVMIQLIYLIRNMNVYIEALSSSFIKHKNELEECKSDILDCIESMINYSKDSDMITFIKICIEMNCWDKMWYAISNKKPDFRLPAIYFNLCLELFQNLDHQHSPISVETLMNIIAYIKRNYNSKKTTFMSDIWFYCIYYDIDNKDINSVVDYDAPAHVIDKIIDKLNTIPDPSFVLGMKLLSRHWNLIFNHKFCDWFSKLISDKSDVRKCLHTLKESLRTVNRSNKQEIYDNFYLIGIRVMSFLNKKSLFTCSKNIFENFLKSNFADIKRALLKVNEKFKLKWTMVECLVSSAEYEKALSVIKEFEVLKDLEVTSADYNRVKEILPNLVWHLLNSSQLLPVIILFEQVVSIFIFNESVDSAYTKNCNEIFDLIVIKVYESDEVEVVKKIISLLDLILSAGIDFEISKESLRYLAVAVVKANIPFKELLDFVDTCFKFNVFEHIQTAEDGLGSFAHVSSSLTYEEIVLLVTWMCRHVKINLVKSVQNQGSNVRENIMKVCSMKFFLHSSTVPDSFSTEIGAGSLFSDFLDKFTEALNNPLYLTHPIKFSTISDISDVLEIDCDNRIVYNTIYYSDI